MTKLPSLTQSLPDALQLNKLANSSQLPPSSSKRALASAEAFEAVFIETMVGLMFEGVKTDGPFGGGSSEKVYRSLMIGETSKQIAKNGGLGLKDDIFKGMMRLQERASS